MRAMKALVFAVLAATFLVACESAEEQAEGHYQSALSLIEAGDFERAEIEFRNVFQLNGQHRDARATYANMLLERGDPAAANAQYLRLAEQYPNDVEARDALTRLALDRQHWDEVERHGDRLRELEPDSPVAQVAELALAYRDASLEEDSPAQEALAQQARTLLEDQPDTTVLRFLLVQQAMNEGRADVAIEELDALLALRDDQPQLYLMKLNLLGSLGRTEEIEAELIDLVDRFPDQEEFLTTLLQFYGSTGRAADAVNFLRGYVDKTPENNEAANTLISLLAQTEGPEAAITEIDRLLTGAGDATILRTQRARLQFESGDRDGGIAAIEQLLDGAEPNETINTAKIVLARMLLINGNEVGARRQVEEVLANDGTNVPALKMQAAWLVEDDDPDGAVNLLRTAIDNAPQDWAAMLQMADAFSRGGNHELARDFISLAVDTSNNAPAPSIQFADLLISEDRLLLAEETLVASLRQNPDNPQLLVKLGQLQIRREDWARVEQIESTLNRIGTEDAMRAAAGFEVARLAGLARVDDAMGRLEELAQTDDSAQTVAAVVRARLGTGDQDGALDLARASSEGDPDNLALRLIYGSTLAGVGQLEEGRAIFEEVVAANDQVEPAWTALIQLVGAMDGADARDATISRARAALPQSAALAWAEASAMTEKGDVDGAIAIYEELYERSSRSPVIANNLATLLATARDDEESLERAFTIARRLRNTEVPAFQDTYGWIAFRRGDVEEAEDYLTRAAAALPNEPSVQYHLGMVYLSQDRKPEALRQFQRAASFTDLATQFPQIALAQAEADKLIAEGVTAAE